MKLINFFNAISFLASIIIVIAFGMSCDHLPNGLCILLGNTGETYYSVTLTVIIIVVNVSSLFIVPLCYYKMHTIIKRSETESSKSKENRSKGFVLPFVNHIYWTASTAVLSIIIISKEDSHTLFVWLNAVILPIGSLTNPFAFTHGKLIHKLIK